MDLEYHRNSTSMNLQEDPPMTHIEYWKRMDTGGLKNRPLINNVAKFVQELFSEVRKAKKEVEQIEHSQKCKKQQFEIDKIQFQNDLNKLLIRLGTGVA